MHLLLYEAVDREKYLWNGKASRDFFRQRKPFATDAVCSYVNLPRLQKNWDPLVDRSRIYSHGY